MAHGCGFEGCGETGGVGSPPHDRLYVGIRIAGAEDGRLSLCFTGEANPLCGDTLVVDSERGLEFAEVVLERPFVFKACQAKGARTLVRVASEEDRELLVRKHAKEREAFRLCIEKSRERALDLKLVRADYDWDLRRLLIVYTSEGRVDFRDLVKDLSKALGSRIEMRQIGVRDGTRFIGGIGPCGLTLCCSTFLQEFHPVTIKMAKNQNLSLNPSKISGQCGRLMCCLAYENEVYLDRRAKGISPTTMPPPLPADSDGEDDGTTR